jgi:tetratricopeptide (TPR) repeat protein
MSTRWTAALIVSGLLLLGGAGASAQAEASAPSDEVDRARGHFKRGVELYRDGDAGAALMEFKRAFEAAPNYRLLYNLGQVSQELREYPAAREYFERYLAEGGAEIDAARKQEVDSALVKIGGRIGSLELTTNLGGVELHVDDAVVGRSPLAAPVEVSAGSHRVSAHAEGRAPVARMVDVAGGETVPVHLEVPVQAKASAVAAKLARPSRTSEAGGSSAVIWLASGTGALAVATGVVAYLAGRNSADYQAAIERKTSVTELDDLSDRAKGKALVADILLGATLAAATVTIVVALTSDDDEPDREGLSLRLGPGQLTLHSRY